MKIFSVLTALLLFTSSIYSQIYFTKNANVSFFSTTNMENIDAKNQKGYSAIDVKTGVIEFSVLMRSFEFEKALMQEHFNENYVESAKYPKCTFKGKITNLSEIDFNKNGVYKAMVKGDMNMHGVTKQVETEGTITVKDGKFTVNSDFKIRPEDYKIIIPKLVRNSIAEVVSIKVIANYEQLKK